MANYAQTVNVIGAIKTTKTEAEFETTGLVLKLYRERFGTIPVQATGEFAPLDIAAALSSDGTRLTVAIVNPTEVPKSITLKLDQGELAGRGRRWVITGPDKWAYNAPGKARRVDIAQTSMTALPNVLALDPLSVTLYALTLR
jgi:alpha-N-arabinofuranosidase